MYGRIPGLTIRTHFFGEPVQCRWALKKLQAIHCSYIITTRVEIALAFRKGFGETSFHVRKKLLMHVFEAASPNSFHLCLSFCETKISIDADHVEGLAIALKSMASQ